MIDFQLNFFLIPLLNLLSLTCNPEKALRNKKVPNTKRIIHIVSSVFIFISIKFSKYKVFHSNLSFDSKKKDSILDL